MLTEDKKPQQSIRLSMSDINDAKSIYLLLKEHPEISLMSPPKSFNIPKQHLISEII